MNKEVKHYTTSIKNHEPKKQPVAPKTAIKPSPKSTPAPKKQPVAPVKK
ncbi:MAG: hypothetical protein OIF36_03880 [Alphaproteobacteria bacterium]|nr:hypothetical protein [Alphaproteobacteria bacterium]